MRVTDRDALFGRRTTPPLDIRAIPNIDMHTARGTDRCQKARGRIAANAVIARDRTAQPTETITKDRSPE